MADETSKKPGAAVAEKPTEPEIGVGDKTVIKTEEEISEATPRRAQHPLPYVVVVDGPRTGARFPLKDGANIIGRAPGNEIRLDDQSVSRQHAEISKTESGWFVKDLGSKNGTMVNGKPVTESVGIGHKDVVKTGIYVLRLITKETPLEEELTLPPELSMADRTVFVAAPPDSLTASMKEEELPPEEPEEEEEPRKAPPPPEMPEEGGEGEAGPPRKLFGILKLPKMPGVGSALKLHRPPFKNTRQILMFATLVGLILAGVVYFGFKFFAGGKAKVPAQAPRTMAAKVTPHPKVPPPVPSTPPKPPTVQPPAQPPTQPAQPTPPPAAPPAKPPVPSAPVVQKTPYFIDFASSPMPAEVTFQGEAVGTTPVRINVQLESGRTYQAKARFVMKDVDEDYTQTVDFTTEPDKSIIPVLFRAPIGILKVKDIPRDVELYLEARYAYDDKFKSGTSKPEEIVMDKPVYSPYGKYVLELRRARKLGETSPTYVTDIIYRREFSLEKESPTYTLEVTEEDLKIFPVKVRSDPKGAEVFVDGKLAGKTPYEGNFPLGEHRLVLRKEGYFEHSEELSVDINTPFIASVKLKTSIAGAHINNARLAMNRRLWQEAINELAQALSSDPAPSEVALSNLMLGQCYFNLNDLQRATGYFEKARESDEQKYEAMLGLVNVYAVQQQTNRALPLLVEVMLKAKDEEVKREANDLFQKISPFRSVIYVYSDPPGADVVVNDKKVAQQTPVILHDLPLGRYRIRIEKPGYLPTDLSLTLSVNEFNPVIVKLKPMPE